MPDNETNNNDLAYADTLWKSADALRGQVDAAEYKHVVLGLLFGFRRAVLAPARLTWRGFQRRPSMTLIAAEAAPPSTPSLALGYSFAPWSRSGRSARAPSSSGPSRRRYRGARGSNGSSTSDGGEHARHRQETLFPDTTTGFQRVAVVMTLLGLGGGLMIEQAAKRVRSWFAETFRVDSD